MLYRKLAVALLAGIVAMPAIALDAEQAQKATETRQSVLKVVGWNIGPLGAMARGLVPYDADLVARNAQRIAWMASMIPDAFRADTRAHAVSTEALPVIWENYARFEELAGNAQASAEKLAQIAAGGDEAAGKQAIGALIDSCRACHDDFRLKD
jgi:cytochrome c556